MTTLRLSPRRHLWRYLPGVCLVATAALSVPPMMASRLTAAPLAIHVSGNQLVDGAGTPVTLHGVDLSTMEYACDQGGTPTSRGWSLYGGAPLDQLSTYQAMASWDINAVRVPLNEDCWLGINGVNPAYGGSNYQSAVATMVSLIHQAGMVAILDLHWNAPGAYAAIGQQPMADADHSITFWQSVATTFKSDPAVIFDLYNEPFLYSSYFTNPSQNAWQCWLDGCSLNQFVSDDQIGPSGQTTGYTTSYTWQTAGMQQLVDAVRRTGATQPILVNGVDWANDDSQWLAYAPQDPLGQLIAGAHDYPGESCATPSCWDTQQAPISATYPFLVGETGDSTTAPVSFLPTFLPYADSHGWSYLAWTWNPWADANDVLITDWSGTPNAGEGAYYKQHLLSLGQSPLSSSTGTPAPTSMATPTPSASASATATPRPSIMATTTPQSAIAGLVNVEPSMRPWHYTGANPQSWWCTMPLCTSDFNVNGQGPMATVTRELQAAKNVGASMVRLEIPWPLIETSRGVFDWSRADAIFAASESVGEPILPVLMWTPQWAGGGAALNQPATNVSDWTTFVTDFTQRYGSLVPAVDVWNEPDSGNYLYNGSAQTYVTDILNPAYAAIKAVDPGLAVVEAGSANDAGGGTPFLSSVIADGGKFDIASFHNYAGTWSSEAQAYRSALNAAGRSATPIWMTEFGVQSSSGNQSAALQSVFGSNMPIQVAGWYNVRDTGAWSCTSTTYTEVSAATWGLLNNDFSAKASYGVLRSLLLGRSAPAPTATPTPTPKPTATPTPTPKPTATPPDSPPPSASAQPTPSPTSSPIPAQSGPNLPWGDNFAADAAGSIPAGWSVSGLNAGFAVKGGDGTYGNVYAHTGWTATTVAGSTAWTDYTLSVDVRPSAWLSESDTIDFRYLTPNFTYAVRFVGGSVIELVRVNGGTSTELAKVSKSYSASWHQVVIQASGAALSVSLDGTTIMTASDSTFTRGAIAFGANAPVEFADVLVS